MDYKTIEQPQAIVHIEQRVTFPILDTKWIPKTAKFVSMGVRSNGVGALKIFELNEGSLNLVREISQKSGFRCGSFGGSTHRTHLAAGDFEGKLQILDIERIDGCVYSVKAHADGLNCIDSIGGLFPNGGAPEILTGGRDGFVKVWDSRQKHSPVVSINPMELSKGGDGSRDCWSVAFGNAFNNSERYVVAGFDNGDIKLFDLRQLKCLWELNIGHGISNLSFNCANERLNKLVACTAQGSLHLFEAQSAAKELTFAWHVEQEAGGNKNGAAVVPNSLGAGANIWCVKHLPQNANLFATCAGSGLLRIWSHKSPAAKALGTNLMTENKLTLLQTVPVTKNGINCFDWSPDHLGLAVSGSFDRIVRVIVTANLNLY